MYLKNILVVLLFIISLTSCGKDPVIKKFFILEFDPAQATEEIKHLSFSPLPYSVKIEPLNISRSYNQERIALRTNSNELQYYYHNQWAQSPASAIRYFLWQRLKQNQLFENCSMDIQVTIPQFLIKGSISQIERLVREDDHAAHIKMTLELVELENSKPIVTYHIYRFESLDNDAKMNVLAQGLSKILSEEIDQFAILIFNELN